MWERITALGTLGILILTAALVWLGLNRPPLPLWSWPTVVFVAVAMAVAAVLNFKLSRSTTKMGGKKESAYTAAFEEDNPHFKMVRNHKFTNETVELDGKRFEDCEFENTTILFHGNAPTELINPKFRGSLQILSDNPAINNFITLSEILRSAPHVAKFDCVSIDEAGHKKQAISSWTRLRFKPVSDAKDSAKP